MRFFEAIGLYIQIRTLSKSRWRSFFFFEISLCYILQYKSVLCRCCVVVLFPFFLSLLCSDPPHNTRPRPANPKSFTKMTMALIKMIYHRLSLNHFSPGVLALFTLSTFLLFWVLGPRRSEKVPFVDGRTSGELFHIGSQRRFAHHGADIVKAAQSRVGKSCS